MIKCIPKCIHKVYMLRCVGTPRVCTHNAFYTPRPFVHPIKIAISPCKKRTSVNFEHIFFESSSYDDICHMPHNSSRICLKKSYSWDMGYWYFTPEKTQPSAPCHDSFYLPIRDRSQLTSTTEGCQQKVDLLFKKAIFLIQNGWQGGSVNDPLG